MSINGIAISNGNILNDSNITLGIYSSSDVLLEEIQTETNSSGMFNWTLTLPEDLPAGLNYVKFSYNNEEIVETVPFRAISLTPAIVSDQAAYEQGQDVETTVTITNSYTGANTDPEQLELRYLNPSSQTVECAKYPESASVPGCDDNILTRTSAGVYTYTFSIGSNPLGVYTQRATVTEDGIAADFDRGFVVALIDPCKPNSAFDYALTYPIQYNNVTDVLTIIGNSSMGTYSNPITTEQMYEFAQATRGTCIIEKPATGTYTIKSQLVIGNGTQEVYVSSKGESVGFTTENMPQLFVNESAHLSFGGIADGIPQEGSSVKFTSNQTDDILLDIAGGELAFYDSYVGDVGDYLGRFMYRGSCGVLDEETSAVNSSITIKKTIFDRAARGQFFYTSNVTIDDIKLNRINSSSTNGYGIVSGCSLPILNNLQIYHQEQRGAGIFVMNNTPANTDLVVTSSTLDYNTKDVIANKDGRGVALVNTQWDRSYRFNWSGDWEGTTQIKESYGYNPTFVDTSSSPIENLTLVLINQYGDVEISQETESSGGIGEQYIKTWQVEKTDSAESESSFNPYTLYAKKYGKSFISEPKSFASRTLETKQVSTNSFTILSAATASAVKNITYNTPTKIYYGDEVNSSWATTGQLAHYPVDQCQYFALFANGTKLAETSNYTIDYETGEITFVQDMTGMEIKPVYFYGGDITITNGFTLTGAYTMSKIYDYLSYVTSKNNLSEDLITIDGINYQFCVNFVIGNDTHRGSVSDSSATISFKDGYDMSFSGLGGYVDLAGITSGGGSSGGLPLNIFDSVGSSYAPGNTVYVFSTVLNNNGQLVDATVDLGIYLPNGTLYLEDTMTATSTGRLDYDFVLPGDAQLGTWRINTDATYGSSEVHDNLAFVVSTSAGGGSGGGTTPSIQIDAPTIINTNENFGIFAFVRNNNSLLVNCDSGASLTLKNTANGTNLLNSVSMTNSATGKYNYTTSLPYQSTFLAEVTCAVGGTTYVSNPKIISSQNVPTNDTGGTGGSAYPTIDILASTPIKTSTTASIGALVKSSSGIASNCDGSLGITIRNLADSTSSSGTMTNFGTGMYNYSWTTPATASVFYINTSCQISGTSYVGFTLLSTQDVGATANIDYNQIAQYVWNYTSRNLTWYNQSVSESIQNCLKDGICSGWWLNTTLTNIHNTVNIINSTANQIKTNTETILSYFNCTSSNEICTRLQNILNNATDIQSRVYSLNTSQIPLLQTGINNVYTDTQYIRTNMATASALQNLQGNITWLVNNVATQSNISSINNELDNLQTDITWLKNNVATQSNITTLLERLTGIDNNLTSIRTLLDCSNPANSDFCTYLDGINITVNYIKDNMATYSQVQNVQNNVSWLMNNVATQEQINNNFTEVINRLANMNLTLWNVYDDLTNVNISLANKIIDVQNNVTWLVNNVATSAEINSNFTETLSRLAEINTTIYGTNNYLYGEITNRLTELNTTAQDTYSYILNNVSTKASLEAISQSLNSINLTLNSVQSQTNCSNPSNSVLCSYISNINNTLSSVYSEMATYSQVSGIGANISWIKENIVTQEVFNANMSVVTNRLSEINSSVDSTYDYLATTITDNLNYLNQTTITIRDEARANNLSIQTKLDNLQSNITWLINNVATSDVINANFSDLRTRLEGINNNLVDINTQVNCSLALNSVLCSYLNSINTTANSIYSEMATQAFLQQVALNVSYVRENMATYSQVSGIGANISWIKDNVATQESINNNFTEVINKLVNMNSTLWNVHDDLTDINISLANQISSAQNDITWIRDNVATSAEINSNFTETLSRLAEINTTIYGTNNYLYGTITNALSEINSTNQDLSDYIYNQITDLLNQINLTTQDSYSYALNNLSLGTNLTEVLAKLDGLSENITFVKNNMFYQGNATGAFLVDYLSTVYAEKNSRAELWILTRDLLGNSKTVSAASCNIVQKGIHIANASISISPGSVYAYWDIPSNQINGEYLWNCTLTGSTLNLFVPFFVSSETSRFEITSLVSASPKYPNENAIVEATFAGQNGSVEPDAINLTIYKPNYLTIWYSANKNDFSRKDNIWYWTQMIEASPTTGAYYVHMTATYNGLTDSRITQFRVATGGPYKVYLECPTMSNIGQNLVCNVILKDEGEAATESTSTIWVDTNNNGVLDSGEPQTSFSKETQPLQNVSEVVTINVPSTHATGTFVVRVDTEYLNSGQPHSTASDSVTLSTVSGGDGGASGGSSGGGGGSSDTGSQPSTIDVQESTTISEQQTAGGIIAQLETNEKVTINFKPTNAENIETHTITMSRIETNSITIVISSNPITLQLATGQEKEVDINGDGIKDIYLKLNKINSGKADLLIKKIIGRSIITGNTINYPEHLMDVEVIILDDYKTVTQNSKVLAKIILYNLGTEEIKDAYITYCIKNAEEEEEEDIKCLKETVAIYTKIELIKEFLVSKDMPEGRYYLETTVLYGNETAQSKGTFLVQSNGPTKSSAEKEFFNFKLDKSYLIIGAISLASIVLLVLILIIVFKKRKKSQKIAIIESKLQHLKELKAKGEISKRTYHAEREKLLQRIRDVFSNKKVMSIVLSGISLIALLGILMTNKPITGYAIGESASRSSGSFIYIIFLICSLGLLMLIHRRKIKAGIEVIKEKGKKKYPTNSISGLVNKKVYTDSGDYVGKIKDIILGENRIDSLKIEVDKKHKFKAKGIVIDYKQVKSVSEVVIIDKVVAEHLGEI
jgi:sporulation protein YlmC with PRC-barrel domain